MDHDRKIIKVDTWKFDSQKEINKLLADGWEIVQIRNKDQENGHNSSQANSQTLFYELRKK